MTNIPVKMSCPLGSKCEEIRDGAIHRCAWYAMIQGQHPTTGEMIDEWRCSIAWQPILMVEMSRTNRGQTKAIESFRNEMVEGNQNLTVALLHRPQAPDMKLVGNA